MLLFSASGGTCPHGEGATSRSVPVCCVYESIWVLLQVSGCSVVRLPAAGAPAFSASLVTQEKDRKTLILLLMTDLRNHELALGKLFSSLLNVGVLLATSTCAHHSRTRTITIIMLMVMWVTKLVVNTNLDA